MIEAIKYYNANTHNMTSGDCVKRAISLAFDLDYEYVAKLLRQKAKELNISSWQFYPVFSSVIKDLVGANLDIVNAQGETLDNFANSHNIGTYIVLCKNQREMHLVTIIDGVIYDSWDSRDSIINTVIRIKSESTQLYDFTEQRDILKDYAIIVLNDLIKKFNFKYGHFTTEDSSDFFFDMEYGFSITCKYNLTDIGIKRIGDLLEIIDYTFSPKRSLEDNKKLVYKLSKLVISRLAKKIKDYIAEYESNEQYEDLLQGDYANILYKLPLWSQKLLISSYRIFSWNYGQKVYDLEFQPLQQDPNRDNLELKEPTLNEIKKQLELYRKTFERPGIDY